jgi:hypothetical protein
VTAGGRNACHILHEPSKRGRCYTGWITLPTLLTKTSDRKEVFQHIFLNTVVDACAEMFDVEKFICEVEKSRHFTISLRKITALEN